MATAVMGREAATKEFWDDFARGEVIACDELPPKVASRFDTEKVRIVEENGKVILSPLDADYQLKLIDMACGMLAGTGLSSYEFMANKKFEKELEG